MRPLKLAILFACKWLGAFALARRLTRRHLKILCYHGFALEDETQFRPKLFISPQTFAQRMARVKQWGLSVLPLDEAVERMYAGKLPNGAVAITIDDGFHSVATSAAPVLAREGFPSTVYVTSYYVKHGVPVYRLAVQYMVWKAAAARVLIKGRDWHPGAEIDLADPAQREALAAHCIRHGEALDDESQRLRICQELGDVLGVSFSHIVEQRLLHLMTPEQLRGLAGQGWTFSSIRTGIAFPPDDEAIVRQEIEDNRRSLLEWLPGRQLRHFCYPSGEWDRRQFAWLDALGVASSTTCMAGLNSAATPRHALYRFLDGANIHPLEFEAAVSGFLDLIKRRN